MAEDAQKWCEAAEALEEEHTLEMVCRRMLWKERRRTGKAKQIVARQAAVLEERENGAGL